MPSVGRHHLELERLVSTQSIRGRQGSVATGLNPTTGGADGWATSGRDAKTLCRCMLVQLLYLDSSTDARRRTSVFLALVLEEIVVLEMVRPQRQRALARRSAQDIMARILDNKSNVVVTSKVDTGHCRGSIRDVNGVEGKLTEGAGIRACSRVCRKRAVKGAARSVLEVGGDHIDRIL